MKSKLAILALVMVCSVMVARADEVVYSNMTGTTGNGGLDLCGTAAAPAGCAPVQSLAEEFTASGNFLITNVAVVVGNQNGTSPLFNVYLSSDSGGVPGSVIEQIGSGISYSGSNIIATGGTGGLVTINTFATPIDLTAGTSYWLVLTSADPMTVVYWDHNTSIPPAPFDVTHDPSAAGGWFPFDGYVGQMEIDGVATPEPSTTWLICAGLTLLFGLRRLRQVRSRN